MAFSPSPLTQSSLFIGNGMRVVRAPRELSRRRCRRAAPMPMRLRRAATMADPSHDADLTAATPSPAAAAPAAAPAAGAAAAAAAAAESLSDTVRPQALRTFSTPFDDLVIRNWLPRDRLPVADLIASVLAEHGLGWDPVSADSDVLDVEHAYRDGEFWVVEHVPSATVVGSAAYYPAPLRDPRAVELRKMYLAPTVRGIGLGSFLLSALEQRVFQLGFTTSVVETASVLKDACQLYRRRGYGPSSGIETLRCDLVLEKELTAVAPPPGVEFVEVVDRTHGWTITCVDRNCATKHRLLFRAVAVLVQSGSHVVVHRRSLQKKTYPGRMAALITGCVDWGETPEQAARREVAEEVGISGLHFNVPFEAFVAMGSDALSQRIRFHPYVATGSFSDEDIVCDASEVESAELMSRAEIVKQEIGGSLWTEFRTHAL